MILPDADEIKEETEKEKTESLISPQDPGDKAESAEKAQSSEEDPSQEMDTYRRKQKELKQKIREIKARKRPNLATLSNQNQQVGWNAPEDEPYIPYGKMTDVIKDLENVKKELPNTRPRLRKDTYRQVLVLQKRQRDFEETQAKYRSGTAEKTKGQNLSQEPHVNVILAEE